MGGRKENQVGRLLGPVGRKAQVEGRAGIRRTQPPKGMTLKETTLILAVQVLCLSLMTLSLLRYMMNDDEGDSKMKWKLECNIT